MSESGRHTIHLVQSTGFRREDETGRNPDWLSAHGSTGGAEKTNSTKLCSVLQIQTYMASISEAEAEKITEIIDAAIPENTLERHVWKL